jgi:hypothetical protein
VFVLFVAKNSERNSPPGEKGRTIIIILRIECRENQFIEYRLPYNNNQVKKQIHTIKIIIKTVQMIKLRTTLLIIRIKTRPVGGVDGVGILLATGFSPLPSF